MFTKKAEKRIQPAPWAALALCAALVVWALALAAWPEAARAQTPAGARATGAADATQRGAGAERAVVVEPGDSLWSISQKRLGPDAPARRVAGGARRLYALNRASIGADPATIFAGQRLALPRSMAASGTAGGPPPGPKAEPRAGRAADGGADARAAEDQASRPEPTGVAGSEAAGAPDERRAAQQRPVGGPIPAADVAGATEAGRTANSGADARAAATGTGSGVSEGQASRPEPTGVAGSEAAGAPDERRAAQQRPVGRTAERAVREEPVRLPAPPAGVGPVPEAARVARGDQGGTPDGTPSPLVRLPREVGSAVSSAGIALSGALSGAYLTASAYLAAGAWDPSRLAGAALIGLACLLACVLLRAVAREAYGRLTAAGAYGGGASYYVSRLPIPTQAPPPAAGAGGGGSAGDGPDPGGPEGAGTGARGRGAPPPRPRLATAADPARPAGASPGRASAKRAAGEARAGRAVPSGLATGTHNLEVRRSLKRGLAARSGAGPRAGRGAGRGPRRHPRRRGGPGAPPKVGAAV